MTKVYKDLINRNDIAKSVEWWNTSEFESEFTGMTVDEAIEYWKAQAEKTDDLGQTLDVLVSNADLIENDETRELISCMLGHPSNDRFRIINDGSYYSHRIWFYLANGSIQASVEVDIADDEFNSQDFKKMSPADKLDTLFKNFEVVYVQLPTFNNRADIINWIEQEQERQMYWKALMRW